MPPNFFTQPPDTHGTQALQNSRRKTSLPAPPSSPLNSPCQMSFTPTEKVLCRPYRHASETEIANSFNSVDLNNSHDRISMIQNYNEPVPPPKPPRRASAAPRIMEYSNDVVNGNRSNTASPELGGSSNAEEPPPIPKKKKNRKPLG